MPFENGGALFLSPDASGSVFLVVLRYWLDERGSWFPGE